MRSPKTLARVRAVAMAVAIVAGGSVAAAVPAATRATTVAQDIPGTVLVGPIATGVLGGDAYDAVYAVDVPQGSVILVDLTGSPNTDFDLYLYDSSATTVLPPYRGLVAQSTSSTSDEHISYPTDVGGRFYIDLNSSSAALGTYTLTFSALIDTTLPIISAVALDGGRPATNHSSAALTVSASDDISGIAKLAVSSDGVSYSDWQAFAASVTVALPPGDGPKSVWVKVRNGAGLASAPAVAQITVDTLAPSVVSIAPAAGSKVSGLRPKVVVRFTERMWPASWTHGIVMQRLDGSRVAGSGTLDSTGTVGTWVPSADLAAGVPVSVGLGSVTDVAGNGIAASPSWALTPYRAASITLAASTKKVIYGSRVTFTGRYVGSSAVGSVVLSARPAGVATYGAIGSAALGTGGAYTTKPGPLRNTSYRVSVGEVGGYIGVGASVTIAVAPRIAVSGTAPGVLRSGRIGRNISVAASISPSWVSFAVSMRIEKRDPRTGKWSLFATRSRPSSGGTVSLIWSTPVAGTYRAWLTTPKTTDYVPGASAIYTWRVY